MDYFCCGYSTISWRGLHLNFYGEIDRVERQGKLVDFLMIFLSEDIVGFQITESDKTIINKKKLRKQGIFKYILVESLVQYINQTIGLKMEIEYQVQ